MQPTRRSDIEKMRDESVEPEEAQESDRKKSHLAVPGREVRFAAYVFVRHNRPKTKEHRRQANRGNDQMEPILQSPSHRATPSGKNKQCVQIQQ